MEIALVSCVQLPEPDRDMAPLEAALRAAGLSYAVVGWDDPSITTDDWSRFRLVLLRATWNYPLMRDAFLDWAARVDAVTRLWNPLRLVRWSSHKRYLLDLEARGVPIAPTVLVPRGSGVTLGEILDARGTGTRSWSRRAALCLPTADSTPAAAARWLPPSCRRPAPRSAATGA